MRFTVGENDLFFFLHYDVAGYGAMEDCPAKKDVIGLLHAQSAAILKHFGAINSAEKGGDELYASFAKENQSAVNVVESARAILEVFNSLKVLYPILSQSGLRIFCFYGEATYAKQLTAYQGKDMDRYIKYERTYAKTEVITITERLYNRLPSAFQDRFPVREPIKLTADQLEAEQVYRTAEPQPFCIHAHNGVAHVRNKPLSEYTEEAPVHRMFIQATHYGNARRELVKTLNAWKKADLVGKYIAFVLHGPDEIFLMFEGKKDSAINFYSALHDSLKGENTIDDNGITPVGPGRTYWNSSFESLFPLNTGQTAALDFKLTRTTVWIIRMYWTREDFNDGIKNYIEQECVKVSGIVVSIHFDYSDRDTVTCLVTLLVPCGHFLALKGLSHALEYVVSEDETNDEHKVGLRKTYHAYNIIAVHSK